MKLSDELIFFFEKQGYVIVNTLDVDGSIHASAKGIVAIENAGKIFVVDLYKAHTYANLVHNPAMSITAVDERAFTGYCLKGTGKIVPLHKIKSSLLKEWEHRVASRISKRLIHNLHEEKKTGHHPESQFPNPEYLIEMDVREIVDLTPPPLRNQNHE